MSTRDCTENSRGPGPDYQNVPVRSENVASVTLPGISPGPDYQNVHVGSSSVASVTFPGVPPTPDYQNVHVGSGSVASHWDQTIRMFTLAVAD